MIEISKDYELKSFGRFSEDLSIPGRLKDRLLELTGSFKKVGNLYLSHLGDDQKVTGLEKKELVEALEEVLIFVVMLRRIDFAPSQDRVSVEKSEGKFKLELKFVEKSLWQFTGVMLSDYQIKNRNFKEWFNVTLSDEIKKFLAIYGSAVADKEITPDERTSIIAQLDKLFLEIVEMIVYIERFMLFQ